MNIIKKIQVRRANRLHKANCELGLAMLDLYFNQLRAK